MVPEKQTQKRIKRHVTGRIRDYFAVTAPGLERLCRKELSAPPLSIADARPEKGGVAFQGRLQDCCLANLHLRTAGRILLRIGEFRATNFRQLTRNAADVPWELFLYAGTRPDIRVSSRNSRLYHTTAVAEHLQAALQARLDRAGLSPSNAPQPRVAQRLSVRIIEDRLSLSLDSSGDNLYKRGLKTLGGRAPLRETTAAAVLMLAGYDPGRPLVDPMCGSGTFSLEAAMRINGIPAGWFRPFAFFGWPAFRPARWEFIRHQARPVRVPRARPLIFAADTDAAACRNLKTCAARHDLDRLIQIDCRDFLTGTPLPAVERSGLVVLNPPYGHRLDPGGRAADLFAAIWGKLEKDYKGWQVALVAPDRHTVRRLPAHLKARRLQHGGLDVVVLTGRI